MVKLNPEELKLVRGGIAGPPIVVLSGGGGGRGGGGGGGGGFGVETILVGANNVSLANHMPQHALNIVANALLSAGV